MSIKIAAVGDKDVIMPFKAIGVEIFPVPKREDTEGFAETITHKLIKEDYGLIIVTEDYAEKLKKVFDEIKEKPLPVIVVIPGSEGAKGFTYARLREIIRKAVGVDILK